MPNKTAGIVIFVFMVASRWELPTEHGFWVESPGIVFGARRDRYPRDGSVGRDGCCVRGRKRKCRHRRDRRRDAPTVGPTPIVGTAAAELTPRLPISVDPKGMPVRGMPPGVVGDVGVDDAARLPEPAPHMLDVPEVSIRADVGAIPDDDMPYVGARHGHRVCPRRQRRRPRQRCSPIRTSLTERCRWWSRRCCRSCRSMTPASD